MAAKRKARRDNLIQRGDVWYFRRVNPITKKREMVSTECKDFNQAKRRKTELEKDQNDNAFGWKEKAKKKVIATVTEWATEFRKVYLTKHKNPSGFAQALAHVANFFGDIPINEPTTHDCERFFASLRDYTYEKGGKKNLHYEISTLETYKTALITVWNKAKLAGHWNAHENPWTLVKLERFKGRMRVLKLDEQPMLMAKLEPRFQRAAKLIILTGLRRAEITTLNETHVDFVQRCLTITGKGEKTRRIPLSPEAADIIREQIAHRGETADKNQRRWKAMEQRIAAGRIFPYGEEAIYVAISTGAVDAGLDEELTVHDLRRTFGTRCAASGVQMKKLQEWMGHYDIKTTAKYYVHTDPTTDIADMAGLRASIKDAPAVVLTFKKEAAK